MKKLLTLLFMGTVLYSCSKDNAETTAITEPTASDFQTQVNEGKFDVSNLGVYEGVFTTLDGLTRATVRIELNGKTDPKITFGFPDGQKSQIKSSTSITKAMSTGAATFNGQDFKVDFTVNNDGTNPKVSNVFFKGQEGAVMIAKETSKAAVTTRTGFYNCPNCEYHPELGDPNSKKTFNFMLVGGSQSNIDAQLVLNRRVYYGTITQSDPRNNTALGTTRTRLNGTIQGNSGPVTVNPANDRNSYHLYSNSVDCSSYQGTFSYVSTIFNDDPGEPAGFTMPFFSDSNDSDDCFNEAP